MPEAVITGQSLRRAVCTLVRYPVTEEIGATLPAAPRADLPTNVPGRAPRATAGRGADIALIATFAALLAALTLAPAVMLSGFAVPITLQTLAVALCGAVLGARRGALAVLLYLLIGFAGLPVFAQYTGGLGVLASPSAGYLLAFPLAAFVIGWAVERLPRRTARPGTVTMLVATVVGIIGVVHPPGIAVLAWRAGLTFGEAAVVDAAFIPGDLIKCVAAVIVAASVHRAFPDLLPRVRPRSKLPQT